MTPTAATAAPTVETDTDETPTVDAGTPSECTECGSSDISVSDKHGETACQDCGAIIDEQQFPTKAGWKHTSSEKHTAETSVTSNDDSGFSQNPLGGTIDWKDMDGYGNSLSSKKRSLMHRLRGLDQALDTDPDEKSNYTYALSEINRISADIDAPRHVRDDATDLYQDILDRDALVGRAIETVATAALYAACNINDVDRDLSELTEVSHADHSAVVDVHTRLVEELDLNRDGADLTGHVEPLCERLDLNDDVQDAAADILTSTVTDEHLESGSLAEHTAAAVYAAAVRTQNKRSMNDVANASYTSVEAVRARYQENIETLTLD